MSDPMDPDATKAEHRRSGRFGRFAKISSMTAGFAARQFTQKVVGAFQNEEQREDNRRKALKTSAEQIADGLGQLKGAAMKVGQMLSIDPELIPDEMADALARLQTEAPPMSFATVKAEVEAALGMSLDEAFSEFGPAPVGSASIGQVHRATTVDGQDVAVKIQYPGIADTIESDMKNLGTLLNLARAKISRERVDAYLDELTEVIKRESDYLAEADNLERFQTVLKDVEGVRVPLPVFDLSRPNLLVMEYVEGTRLSTWITEAPEEDRLRAGTRLIQSYITMMHDHQTLHADPHPGNFLVDDAGRIVFLDLGCVRDYDRTFTDGLLHIIIAMWRHDVDALMVGLEECGFATQGIDPELIYEWLGLVLAPLLTRGPFDYGTWNIQEQGVRFVKKHPALLNFHPPREALFYLRVLAGLRGLMGTGGVKIDAYRLARDGVKARGYM